jgi:calcineurin-like phosphoesterase family protein
VLVGAGDIAECYEPQPPFTVTPPRQTPAEATAKLLDGIEGTVIAVGDNAYEAGSPYDYWTCYDPTWGRHASRTRPAVGNHEYITPGALGYYLYYGAVSAPPLGYYSYDLGTWHVVVLNSMSQWTLCPQPQPSLATARACAGDRAQQIWLKADLAAHPNNCTVAYFHHPRFSSGMHGSQYEVLQLWDILYRYGVDVVISGHDHLYERFAPQNPDGVAVADGIRQFTVGTGGASLYSLGAAAPNSEVLDNHTFGVLKLDLDQGSYRWSFVPVAGSSFRDAGSGECH